MYVCCKCEDGLLFGYVGFQLWYQMVCGCVMELDVYEIWFVGSYLMQNGWFLYFCCGLCDEFWLFGRGECVDMMLQFSQLMLCECCDVCVVCGEYVFEYCVFVVVQCLCFVLCGVCYVCVQYVFCIDVQVDGCIGRDCIVECEEYQIYVCVQLYQQCFVFVFVVQCDQCYMVFQ